MSDRATIEALEIFARRCVMAVDPVCKMAVEPARAAAQSKYQGETYYFCAVGCKQKFDREPEKYLAGGQSEMGR